MPSVPSTTVADVAPTARSAPTFWRRHARNLWGGQDRIPGVDVARGIAILGMFTAHVGFTTSDFSTLPGWLSLAHGRSSILFAIVAGVSLSLVSGRQTPFTGVRALQTRTRILVRAVLLLAVVGLLDLLGTRVLLILGFYAAYFILALPFLTWRPRRLLLLAAVTGVVGPMIAYWLPELLARAGLRLPSDGSGALTDFLVTGHYPAIVWMAYVFVGMAIGRMDLRSWDVRALLISVGVAMAGIAYALSGWAIEAAGGPEQVQQASEAWSSQLRAEPFTWQDPLPTADYLWLAGPHTDTTLEVFGSGGFALAILGLCLLVGRIGSRVLAPLAAVGSMALTVYSLQIVALWWWGDDAYDTLSNGPLLVMILASLLFATLWRWAWARGPLERGMAAVANRAASLGAPAVNGTVSRT